MSFLNIKNLTVIFQKPKCLLETFADKPNLSNESFVALRWAEQYMSRSTVRLPKLNKNIKIVLLIRRKILNVRLVFKLTSFGFPIIILGGEVFRHQCFSSRVVIINEHNWLIAKSFYRENCVKTNDVPVAKIRPLWKVFVPILRVVPTTYAKI